jgi:uncharacterized membrane protein YkoI
MKLRWFALVLAVLAATPSAAACLSDRDARRVIAEGSVISVRKALDDNVPAGSELLSARLCEGKTGLVYRIAVIDAMGRVTRLLVDAATGDVLPGR